MSNRSLWFLLLAACVGPDDIEDANDRDDDGYEAFQAGGDDCDDDDAAVNPGADEVCGNATDDDCDGVVDDDGVGAITYYPDVDLDTFGDLAGAVSACAAPVGHVLVAGDCNDGSVGVNPAATEVWYDGVDQDCDGGDDYDQDGDGFQSAAEAVGGDDCDDLVAAVKPGAAEVCGNLVDDDCDGGHDACDWSGVTVRTHRLTVGSSVTPFASLGDVDDDGAHDMVVWLPDDGDVHFFWGGWMAAADLTLLDALPVFTMPTPQAGYPLAVSIEQDLTGDGGADLVVGTWRPTTTGEVLLFDQLTRVMPPFEPDDFTRRWTGPTDSANATSNGFGSRVVGVGKAPGAALGTLALPYLRPSAAPRCFLLHDGPQSGVVDAISSLIVDGCSGALPGGLRTEGGEYLTAEVGLAYHLVDSASPSDLDASVQPEAALWPGTVNADALRVVDLDDDGYGDVLAIETGPGDPAVRVPYGPIVGDGDPPGFYLRLEADPAAVEEFLDVQVADLNGDHVPDLAVLMDLAFTGDPGGTAVGVLFGPMGPPDIETYTDVDRAFFDAVVDLPTGERATSMHVGDTDGDGYDDVALPGPGQVRVLYGAGR